MTRRLVAAGALVAVSVLTCGLICSGLVVSSFTKVVSLTPSEIDAIRSESELLASKYQRTYVDPPYPPAIAALKPQIVRVSEEEGVEFVDIQLTGGFRHAGILVVADRQAQAFVPRKGQNWDIEKIAERVFTYEE